MQSIRTLGLAALVLVIGAAFAAPVQARDDHRRGHDRSHSGHDWRREDDHRREHRGGDRHAHRHDDRRHRHDRHVRYDRYDRPVVRVVHMPPRRHVVHHRGPPPWARGDHYRHAGYAPTYVVHDYRPYGLRHPPRGHHWRRSESGDFLLVAIATGLIADVIFGR